MKGSSCSGTLILVFAGVSQGEPSATGGLPFLPNTWGTWGCPTGRRARLARLLPPAQLSGLGAQLHWWQTEQSAVRVARQSDTHFLARLTRTPEGAATRRAGHKCLTSRRVPRRWGIVAYGAGCVKGKDRAGCTCFPRKIFPSPDISALELLPNPFISRSPPLISQILLSCCSEVPLLLLHARDY